MKITYSIDNPFHIEGAENLAPDDLLVYFDKQTQALGLDIAINAVHPFKLNNE